MCMYTYVYISIHYTNPFARDFLVTRQFYIDELWQMDLCDTSSLKQFNDGDIFILSIIGVFSKIGFASSLKDRKRSHRIKSVPKCIGRKRSKVNQSPDLC